MSSKFETHGIVALAADVVGSTALYVAVGDARARALIAECLTTLKGICSAQHGRVVAEVGDQIVAHFTDAERAASAASDMHAVLNERRRADDANAIRVRIGLHYGPPPGDADVLVSETTKLANWASTNAKPEQTLATRALIDQLPRIFRAVSRYVDDETWNFFSLAHVELYEIIWDVESITAYTGEKPERDAEAYEAVEFEYDGKRIIVDVGRPVISIGRDANCDLVIPKDLVSRQHLSAQFSRRRCTVTDKSTNGSVVVLADGSRFSLKRESCRLAGEGMIVPGKPPKEDGFVIRYRCLETR